MTNDELKKTIEASKAVTREHTSSKEKAMAFLVKMGTHKPSGELTDAYKKRA
jgi:hypothetical protein